jgi:hypothetical protein
MGYKEKTPHHPCRLEGKGVVLGWALLLSGRAIA